MSLAAPSERKAAPSPKAHPPSRSSDCRTTLADHRRAELYDLAPRRLEGIHSNVVPRSPGHRDPDLSSSSEL